jgi:sulfide:quinone oxidoreductase
MRRLLILGAGTAGTIVANKLRRRLGTRDWTITVVDRARAGLRRPALLGLPFGEAGSENLFRPHDKSLRRGITFVLGEADRVVPHTHHVRLTDGRRIDFDYLIVATGATPAPQQLSGLMGPQWRHTVHECFTPGGAIALRPAVHRLAHNGGRLAVLALGDRLDDLALPSQFLAKADSYLHGHGVRDRVELLLATPMDVGRPTAMSRIEAIAERHKAVLESGFVTERLDSERSVLVARDGRELPFDLLVTMPPRTGAAYVGRSGLGDTANLVEVDPQTLRSKAHADIFAIGSAAAQPCPAAPTAQLAAFADIFACLSAGFGPAAVPLWRHRLARLTAHRR